MQENANAEVVGVTPALTQPERYQRAMRREFLSFYGFFYDPENAAHRFLASERNFLQAVERRISLLYGDEA